MKWKVKREIEDKFFNFYLNKDAFSKIDNHLKNSDLVSRSVINHKNEFLWEIGLKLYYMSTQYDITKLYDSNYYKFSNYQINSFEIYYRSPTKSLKGTPFLSIIVQLAYYDIDNKFMKNMSFQSIELDRIIFYYNKSKFLSQLNFNLTESPF